MKLFHGISYHKLPIVDYQPIIHHINIDRDRSHVRCSHIIDVSIIIIGHIVRYSHRYELCIIRNDMRIPRSGHVLLLRILWGDGRTSSILRLLNNVDFLEDARPCEDEVWPFGCEVRPSVLPVRAFGLRWWRVCRVSTVVKLSPDFQNGLSGQMLRVHTHNHSNIFLHFQTHVRMIAQGTWYYLNKRHHYSKYTGGS